MGNKLIYKVDDKLNLNYLNFNVVHGGIIKLNRKKMVTPQANANILKASHKDMHKR